jgi:predicted membrane-bound spermidine synthase
MKEIKNYSNLLLIIAFLEGGIVMCIELLGARFLAPVYGSSLEVWSIVLAMSVGALTLGYFVGGFFSQKNNKSLLLHLLLVSAGILILLMPILAKLTIKDFNPQNLIFDCLVATLVFIAPPLFLLGSTTPIIIELKSNSIEESGKAAGNVYGISTIGGIFFTYLTGFYLIPQHGLTTTTIVAAVVIASIPFFILIKEKKYIALILVPVFVLSFFNMNAVSSTSPDVKVLHYSEGMLGQLLLVDLETKYNEFTSKERAIFVNRIGQTWVNAETGDSRWDYPNFLVSIASTLKPNPNVLVLGLGGGTVPRYFESILNAKVEAVEIDSRMESIAKQYFSLGNTKVHINDARHFIETTYNKYDLIVFDLYKGESPPSHTLSLETFKRVKSLLLENGICIINFNGFIHDKEGLGGRSLLKTLQEAGFEVKIIPTFGEETYRNNLYVASVKPLDLSSPKLPLPYNGKSISLDSLAIDLKTIPMDDAILITDDLPILEKLNTEASKAWRASYYKNYTKNLEEKGITIFK